MVLVTVGSVPQYLHAFGLCPISANDATAIMGSVPVRVLILMSLPLHASPHSPHSSFQRAIAISW